MTDNRKTSHASAPEPGGALPVLVEIDSHSVLYDAYVSIFEKAGIDAVFTLAETPEERLANIKKCRILVSGTLPKEIAGECTHLDLVQLMSKGFIYEDVAEAGRHRIPVCGIGPANSASVAQYTWGLVLSLAKRIVLADRLLRENAAVSEDGQFFTHLPVIDGRPWRVGFDVWGKTMGIVGLGDIGSRVARIAHAFNMRLLACDPYISRETFVVHGAEPVDLPVLLRESDIVSLHVPQTAETEKLIGRKELSLMKESALLINTARGSVVDEAALYDCLRSGGIAGAGLDVFEKEPLPPDSRMREFLGSTHNVILAPHLGAATVEALENIVEAACENIRRVSKGELPLWILNQDQFMRKE